MRCSERLGNNLFIFMNSKGLSICCGAENMRKMKAMEACFHFAPHSGCCRKVWQRHRQNALSAYEPRSDLPLPGALISWREVHFALAMRP
jgi:hypothetical protein